MKKKELGCIPYDKSNNVEISLFRSMGRISRKSYILRLLLCIIIWFVFHAVNILWAKADYNKYIEKGGGKIQDGARIVETRYNICKNIDFVILPSFLAVFLLIQTIKRAHDINKSGWTVLIPFYWFYIVLTKGTEKNNDYGLVPYERDQCPSYRYENEESES